MQWEETKWWIQVHACGNGRILGCLHKIIHTTNCLGKGINLCHGCCGVANKKHNQHRYERKNGPNNHHILKTNIVLETADENHHGNKGIQNTGNYDARRAGEPDTQV